MDVLGALGIPSPAALRGMGTLARQRLGELAGQADAVAHDAGPLRAAAAGTPSPEWESEAADLYAAGILRWSRRAETVERTLGEAARELRLAGEEVDQQIGGMASWLEGMERKMVETAGRAAKTAGEVLVHEGTQGFRREIEAVKDSAVLFHLPSALGTGA